MLNRFGKLSFDFANYTFFLILAFSMLYPFWYIIMFSISVPGHASGLSHFYFWPQGFSLATYEYILRYSVILTGLKNTLIVTAAGTAVNLLMTSLTAYPLSQQLRGKGPLSNFILFTMIFSGGIIPTYVVVRAFGMVDTLWALFIPSAISVYYLLIMIKFFRGIPVGLIESAKIDGYNDIFILLRIVLPLSTAVLASLGLFYAVAHWNAYLPGVIYINDREKRVLQVILRAMLYEESLRGVIGRMDASATTPQSMKMAAVVISLLPILMVYPFIQKYFMKGIMIGAVKG